MTLLITGATSKIGKELVRHFSESDKFMCLHYNHTKPDGRLKRFKCLGCDFLDEDSISGFMDRAFAACPGINLLINNAACYEKASLLRTTDKMLDRHFNLNFRAPFILTREFARRVKNGHVINILDCRIEKNKSACFAYTLSKKMLAEFTRMAACDLAPAIRVNAIAPGHILPAPEKALRDFFRALDFLIDTPGVTGQIMFVAGK